MTRKHSTSNEPTISLTEHSNESLTPTTGYPLEGHETEINSDQSSTDTSCPFCAAGYPAHNFPILPSTGKSIIWDRLKARTEPPALDTIDWKEVQKSHAQWKQDLEDAAAGKSVLPALARLAALEPPSGKSRMMMNILATKGFPESVVLVDSYQRGVHVDYEDGSGYQAARWAVKPEWMVRNNTAEQHVADMVKESVGFQIERARTPRKSDTVNNTTTKSIEEQMVELEELAKKKPPSILTRLNTRTLLETVKSSIALSLENYLFEPNK